MRTTIGEAITVSGGPFPMPPQPPWEGDDDESRADYGKPINLKGTPRSDASTHIFNSTYGKEINLKGTPKSDACLYIFPNEYGKPIDFKNRRNKRGEKDDECDSE